ncbi:MAG: HPF/RaiA family ribosome-associated protein [Patescibacteria group bacterium]
MNLDISGKGIELTPSIKIFIEEKLGGIAKFIQKFDEEGAAELRVLIGRSTAHHHKGEVYFASANLQIPGKELRAEDLDADVRVAIDGVRRKLLSEIETYKGHLNKF